MEGFSVIIVPKSDEGFHASSSFSASGFLPWPLHRVCVFQNTSGSTSIPKTFGLTYERLLTLTTRYASDANERRSLRTGSIEFDAHRLAQLAAMLAGNCSVFLREITLTSLVTQCEQAEVTGVSMGVYRLGSLLQGERQNSRRLPPFTTVHSGGSRVPGRLRRELVERLTDNLYVLYATSEVGMISRATPDQHQSFPEGVGFPRLGCLSKLLIRTALRSRRARLARSVSRRRRSLTLTSANRSTARISKVSGFTLETLFPSVTMIR